MNMKRYRYLSPFVWVLCIMLGFYTLAWAADTKFSALTELASGDIADADMVPIVDATGPTPKKTLWSSIKAALKTYFDSLYQPADADLTTWGSVTPTAAAQAFNSGVTPTYVNTLTSDAQAQINGKQAADADLTTYAGITPSANVQTMLGSADNAAIRSNIGADAAYAPISITFDGDPDSLTGDTVDDDKVDNAIIAPPAVQAVTCVDSGTTEAATLTITPTAGLGRVDVRLTVNDADGCTITMGEVGATTGTLVTITNVSAANTATFTTSANVLTLKRGSPYVMGANEMIGLLYTGSLWLEQGRTGSEQVTILDDAAQIANSTDTTKKVKIDASNQGAGQTGTIQAPVNGTFVAAAGTGVVHDGATADIGAVHLLTTGQMRGGAKTYSVASGVAGATQLNDVTGKCTLLAAEVSGTLINVDASGVTRFTLPTPASGYNTVFTIGISGVTVQVESGTTMYVNGTATATAGVGAQIVSVTIGEYITCWTANVPGAGEIEWMCRKQED
jgi:hypothetical protein